MIIFDDEDVRYPIGEHSFRNLRKGGFLYVDKTYLIARLLRTGKFIYLSRPRRFGKSLLLSTIECYFRGEKELFQDTWIGEHEKDWEEFPVLHFDMTISSGTSARHILDYLHEAIDGYEKQYEVSHSTNRDIGTRFNTLINSVSRTTGKKVVVLIDEYDKGIIETLDAPEPQKKEMMDLLRAFYSQPKAATESVQFCMITGVARFSSYTLFSGPNNFLDISMNEKFATICGITQEELNANFDKGIGILAETHNWTKEKAISVLKQKYDSYRFTPGEDKVYNPFSLLWVFTENRLDNYWIKSGTSRVFVDYLSRSEFDLLELQNLWVDRARMESKFDKTDSIPLLFQTGYLTIVEVERDENGSTIYRLGIPNGEVREALVNSLIPKYMGISESDFLVKSRELKRMFISGDVKGWIEELKALIAKVPYRLFNPGKHTTEEEKTQSIIRLEKTYHIIVQMIFQMLSLDSQSEISVSGGSIDMVATTDRYVYVMEFKLDGSSEEALQQIDSKGYALSWVTDNRTVYKIGIAFSPETRTISSYTYTCL